MQTPSHFAAWYAALEQHHLANLTFAQVRRSAEALSAIYVQQRHRLDGGAALDGRGKRAAFALLYAPLHHLIVHHVVASAQALQGHSPAQIIDLGCGTGVGGAAWALQAATPAAVRLLGIDNNAWALGEARWNWQALGLHGAAKRADATLLPATSEKDAIVAAFFVNELDPASQDKLLLRLLRAAAHGTQVLIIEPIGKRMVPWWPNWQQAFAEAGGIAQEHRFRPILPERLALLSRAAKRDHTELTARSLLLAPSQSGAV